MEKGSFILGNEVHLTEHLRGGELVMANRRVDRTNGFEKIPSADAGNPRRCLRLNEPRPPPNNIAQRDYRSPWQGYLLAGEWPNL